MIESKLFLDECKKNAFTLFTGTPCSYLKPFINTVIDDPELKFVGTTNEGDAVALATGAKLGGINSIVMFQNSGLGNTVNPLTSLSYIIKVPFLGIVTLRGEPNGAKDEPQHELMGQITISLLEIMKIPWAYFPTEKREIGTSFANALRSIKESSLPFFFVMRKDSVDKYELKNKSSDRIISHYQTTVKKSLTGNFQMMRSEALKIITKSFSKSDVFIATTGKTGRELFEIEDQPNQFYMVGSMGCASAIGVGLACTKFSHKICIIDGDGALLMRMGNMALVGVQNNSNLVHILLDNGVHDSTGGQKSFSEVIDFCEIATHCGYKKVYQVDNLDGLSSALHEITSDHQLSFLRVFIKAGSPAELGRPSVKPQDVAKRFENFVKNNI